MGIQYIFEDIREIYKEKVLKKEVKRVNKKVDEILDLIQRIVEYLKKKKLDRNLIRIPIKKKKKKQGF